jgi:hypothetical protein
LGSAEVVHPFHPLRGQRFVVLKVRRVAGVETLSLKINGVDANPPQWPDGSYSIQGAAAALGVTTQTIFDYLARGLLAGHQLTKGQPWQIDLSAEQIDRLRAHVQRIRRSKMEAS